MKAVSSFWPLRETISLNTKGFSEMVDITKNVLSVLGRANITDGLVTVFCPGSTGALTTIEYEPGCISDLRRLFNEIASPDRVYQHEEAWADGNGHSHVRAALLKASLTVPFVHGRLTLGTWQQIIYVDFDIRPRKRELVVQILGE